MAAEQKTGRMGTKPPGLKSSKGANACGNCAHFEAALLRNGRCRLFDYSVAPTQVSDRYKPRDAGGKR